MPIDVLPIRDRKNNLESVLCYSAPEASTIAKAKEEYGCSHVRVVKVKKPDSEFTHLILPSDPPEKW